MSIVSSARTKYVTGALPTTPSGDDRRQPPQSLAGQPCPLVRREPVERHRRHLLARRRRYRDPGGILAIGRARPPGARSLDAVATRFVIIGGGPAGNTAATYAARLGAEVTLVERDIVGGAAHLWDCIPSKAMIATGGAMAFARRSAGWASSRATAEVDIDGAARPDRRHRGTTCRASSSSLLDSQGVRMHPRHGPLRRARTRSWSTTVDGVRGARRRRRAARHRLAGRASPTGAGPTASASSPPATATRRQIFPEHLVVIGSGVTGVEFVHMFSSFGVAGHADRQPPAGAAGQGPRGGGRARGRLPRPRRAGCSRGRGPRASTASGDEVVVRCDDGRVGRSARHAVLAIGSVPEHRGARPRRRRASSRPTAATSPINHHCQSRTCRTSTPPATSAASCRCRRWPRCRAARSPST